MNENKFANDGSFLEMFKKKMEEERGKKQSSEPQRTDESVDINQTCETSSGSTSGSGSAPGLLSDDVSSSDAGYCVGDSDSRVTCTSESSEKDEDAEKSSPGLMMPKKPVTYPIVGKRRGRGAPVLKTGAVKKQKKEEEQDPSKKKDAWALYMAEVKKYKEQSCQDEDKTRPLVK